MAWEGAMDDDWGPGDEMQTAARQGTHQPSAMQTAAQPGTSTEWWRALPTTAVDAITLEPLRELARPPFDLPPGGDDDADHGARWCDGAALALFLLEGTDFSHPLSRRALTRAECARLDAHLDAFGFSSARPIEARSWRRRGGQKRTARNTKE